MDTDRRQCVQVDSPFTNREQTVESNREMTDAEILFLWDEHRKKGQIQVWMDLDGVLHFKAEEHPGVTFRPALRGDETMGYHV